MPAAVKDAALAAQAKCFRDMSRSVEANGGQCGSGGCRVALTGCYVRGEEVVLDAIDVLLKTNESRVAEHCRAGLTELANEAATDNPWLDRIMRQLPIDLAGDPIILYRLYFYELMYRTAMSPECKS